MDGPIADMRVHANATSLPPCLCAPVSLELEMTSNHSGPTVFLNHSTVLQHCHLSGGPRSSTESQPCGDGPPRSRRHVAERSVYIHFVPRGPLSLLRFSRNRARASGAALPAYLVLQASRPRRRTLTSRQAPCLGMFRASPLWLNALGPFTAAV